MDMEGEMAEAGGAGDGQESLECLFVPESNDVLKIITTGRPKQQEL